MKVRTIKIQAIVLFLLILANFIAQIPYYIDLYYNPNNLFAEARGIVLMLLVFCWFLMGTFLLFRRTAAGYWTMFSFLLVEFLFYLWNTIGEVIHGYGLFFHLHDPNFLLRMIFAVGYINLFASGYFLFLLIYKKGAFIGGGKDITPTHTIPDGGTQVS